ncbi:hypothetical protein ACIA74_32480 [Streptomyces sp. NPDC051658]|uniref:hypothetical protein n=1 Tax=Streptomyces sp. NPDC051658 TaxID=3365667 RepID=UPI0037ACEF02
MLVSALVAATGTPPRMRVTEVRHATPSKVPLLTVRVTNAGDRRSPLTSCSSRVRAWAVAGRWCAAPATMPAHGTAVYALRPPKGTFPVSRNNAEIRVRLRAFTGDPQALSSVDVRHLLLRRRTGDRSGG